MPDPHQPMIADERAKTRTVDPRRPAPRRRCPFAVGAVAAVALLVMTGCSSGSDRATTTTTTTTTLATVATRTVTAPPPSMPARPTVTPTVGPGTRLGAEEDGMRYGSVSADPLDPCSVLDPDAGDLVGIPLRVDDDTPNNCEAYLEGKGFALDVNVGNMAEAIDKVRRCAYADDEQDQCPLPEIIDDFDARTFLVDGVTVITEDYLEGDDSGGGMLVANVAMSKKVWVGLRIFFDGRDVRTPRKILDQLVGQVVARSKG